MPVTLAGVADAAQVTAATTVSKTGVRGNQGTAVITLAITNTTTITGSLVRLKSLLVLPQVLQLVKEHLVQVSLLAQELLVFQEPLSI